MGSRAKKKVRILEEKQDRISILPDELIHKILSSVDAKEAVQTSVLSKRWKLIWTTLPFLNFVTYGEKYKLIRHVLYNRNHQSHISELKLCICLTKLPGCLLENFVEYAILRNVECLIIDLIYANPSYQPYKLSTLSSNSLKKLTLEMKLEEEFVWLSDFWDLPVLTTLHLKRPCVDEYHKLPDSCLTCLPALRTLCLDDWDLLISSFAFSLPNLTTLRLCWCKLPETVWDFPSLLSLDLDDVILPDNMSDILSALPNLQNLKLSLKESDTQQDYFISCPRLVNLNIMIPCYVPHSIVVLAPKLCNFSSVGIFSITFGGSELKNVDIKLQGWFEKLNCKEKKKYCPRFTSMLQGLGNAKNLTFDLESIQALSEVFKLLVSFPSPFYNLKYVKLPRGYNESSISSALRSSLLGGSPKATIVTTLPQNNMIPPRAAVSVTAENVVLQEPFAPPTMELVDCQYINRTVSISVDTIYNGFQEQYLMESSLIDADKAGQTEAPVEGTSNNRVSSSKGNTDFRLWRGHEVNSEFVCLLDRIMHTYPETFEHFTTKNKNLCTLRLNMLCTSLTEFTKIALTAVDYEIIVEYRDIFAYLQNLGFNLSWLVRRLNYVQHLRFSKPLITELHAIDCRIDDAKGKVQDLQARVDDAKNKLQNLQTLRAEKMTEIQKDFGTIGTNLAVGYIGDDLLSGP